MWIFNTKTKQIGFVRSRQLDSRDPWPVFVVIFSRLQAILGYEFELWEVAHVRLCPRDYGADLAKLQATMAERLEAERRRLELEKRAKRDVFWGYTENELDRLAEQWEQDPPRGFMRWFY
jgi:hypothetical protein